MSGGKTVVDLVAVENLFTERKRVEIPSVLVETGVELSCFPATLLESIAIPRHQLRRFRRADGSVFERSTGPARLLVAGVSASDEVVFGEPGDIVVLGSRSLRGLNLVIDPVSKRLSDAGPMPAAHCAEAGLAHWTLHTDGLRAEYGRVEHQAIGTQ